MLQNLNRLKSLKQDFLDGLVDITAINADTVRIDIKRFDERTGDEYVYRSEELNLSDVTEAKAPVQELATLLNQLETAVTNALDAYQE
jgi:hypothetical protein